MDKKTKIIATISTSDTKLINDLYQAGMDAVRINTAHTTLEDALKIVQAVREVSDHIAIIIDTKGPNIRCTHVKKHVKLKKGNTIKIQGNPDKLSDQKTIFVSYKGFVKEVPLNSRILISDGEIELKVIKKNKQDLVCSIENDAVLKGHKSVNVPNVKLNLPALTQRDKEYVQFCINHDIDFIAHSFVRSKQDLLEIQKILDKKQSKIKLIAKIENQQGIDNIKSILEASYGVMVARGDMALEIPPAEVPLAQKKIIRLCIERAKPAITATQMLHSMIENPRPTRAEISDISNAILDGSDCCMLSGETAIGRYPVASVKTMAEIAKRSEREEKTQEDLPLFKMTNMVRSWFAKAAMLATLELPIKAILVQTNTGRSANVISAYRGRPNIFAISYDKRIARELAITFGVRPRAINPPESTSELLKWSLNQLVSEKLLKPSDFFVMVGRPPGKRKHSIFIEINKANRVLKKK